LLIQTIDLARFIQIYIIQLGIGGIYFLIITALILRRSTKNLNQIFSMFFISVAIGTVINVIYAPLTNSVLVKFLNIFTYFMFCLAMVFLLIFNLMLLKSEKVINPRKQVIIVIIWALILLGLFFIGMLSGVSIDEKTDWKPVWDLPFFLYGIIVCSIFMIIPTIFTSIQIYKDFEDEEIKKKWMFFLIGISFYYFMWAGTTISNFLAKDLIRSVWGIIALIAFLAIYAMYYGVGKQIED